MANRKMDYSKHLLKIVESGRFTVYEFYKPDTNIHGLSFIVGMGVTSVIGDFGNWIIDRELHPSSQEKISRDYMDSKVRYASTQTTQKYDPEGTLKEINKFVRNFKKDYDRVMNQEEKEWVKGLKEVAEDSEHSYFVWAYENLPGDFDSESIPIAFKREAWLDYVYDAFDAMCDFITKERKQSKKKKRYTPNGGDIYSAS